MTHDEHAIDIWRALLTDQYAPLLDAAADTDATNVADVARLRKTYDAEHVAAALELVSARRKAKDKFPHAESLVADRSGVEQATSHLVAEYKARRFVAANVESVADLCCGVGGDTMALSRSFGAARVTAVDLSPLRAWMTERNAGCETIVADVAEYDINADAVHLDPARRSATGARRHHYEDYEPGPEHIAALLDTVPHCAIKLGPGVDIDALPLDESRELEVVNEHGALVQAILWSGDLATAPSQRTATRLPTGETFTAKPQFTPCAPVANYLHAVDPALERLDLIGAFCAQHDLAAIHPQLGLLSSDAPLDNPWLTSFELRAELPWRRKRVKQWLRAHDAGVVEIKTRGRVVDPDVEQRNLRGDGATPYTVFILRFDERVVTYIAQRGGQLPR